MTKAGKDDEMKRWKLSVDSTYILELLLEELHHVLLDDDALLVEVLDDEVVVDAVDVDDDGFDGGIAFDQDA